MNREILQKLRYTYKEEKGAYSLPGPVKDSFHLITDFFEHNSSNKLCLVFSSKELAAQWLAIPMALTKVKEEFIRNGSEILNAYKAFKIGDRLLLNNKAVVMWAGMKPVNKNGISKELPHFMTKSSSKSESLLISIPFEKIIELQPTKKTNLSSQKKVMSVLPGNELSPLELLLGIRTFGNTDYIKGRICLVSKYKSFDAAFENIKMNLASLEDYFSVVRVDENGIADTNSPLLLVNNLSNLSLYSIASPITKIIIDGFSAIQERGTDFSDIDKKGIQTILITDLTEIESFELISNYGFEFFNFTKENLKLEYSANNSPFHSFENKLRKYVSFNVVKEICQNTTLELTIQKIHSIEKDESNNDLNTLRISLIQLVNLVSRIAHIPTTDEIYVFNSKINSIDALFLRSSMWLGDSQKSIEESISLLKSVIEYFATQPSEKCTRLKTLMLSGKYDYIICATGAEAKLLDDSLPAHIQKPRVISVADVNDKLLSSEPQKAILIGWPKSSYLNRIISSFLFSELTVLFYQFENTYYDSLQRRNRQHSESGKATVNCKGNRLEAGSSNRKGFEDLYAGDEIIGVTSDSSFDILDFELRLDNAQYSRYAAMENLTDSTRSKRIVFEGDFFIYTTESHKFLVINELIERNDGKANLYGRKVESLQTGDVIAFINTERDILADLVEKNTDKQDLATVKKWTDLWKDLLKNYFEATGSDFNRLVTDLRAHGCKRHEVTIRMWLQDENRIGPSEDSDLISIGEMTKSKELIENIDIVRQAISKMIGWRMQAADFIANQIKLNIHNFIDYSVINDKIEVQGLGSITIIKINSISNVWEFIDDRYVNRLLQKEIV